MIWHRTLITSSHNTGKALSPLAAGSHLARKLLLPYGACVSGSTLFTSKLRFCFCSVDCRKQSDFHLPAVKSQFSSKAHGFVRATMASPLLQMTSFRIRLKGGSRGWIQNLYFSVSFQNIQVVFVFYFLPVGLNTLGCTKNHSQCVPHAFSGSDYRCIGC